MRHLDSNRGFTLVELMIAGVVSVIVVMGGFMAITSVQRASARQQEADDVVGAARVAMEVMSRDIRTAGDSINLFPAHCLGTNNYFPTTLWKCPAVLDPHPWRISIARNAWTDSTTAPDGSRFSTNDGIPPGTRLFTGDPENAVTFRFVPDDGWAEPHTIGGRNVIKGRIERVRNPFRFPASAPQAPSVSVLLDNVILDDAMRFNPADPTDIDHRYDYSLFMYQLITKNDELNGDASLVQRDTTAADWALTPPINLFTRAVPAGYPNDLGASPATNRYSSTGYTQSLVGLNLDTTAPASLVNTPTQDTTTVTSGLYPNVSTSELRYLLDRNHIRAVRVAFKVAASHERPDVLNGLDLDGDPSNGTAQLYSFETTVEIKPLSRFLTDA